MRDIESGRWLRADGTLSQDLRDALETETLSEALEFCRKRKLRGIEIVLRFGDPRYDSTIHVSDTVMIHQSQR